MSKPRAFIFGPVPSRRLGRSLGIDLIPPKICTLDCIYCEVGPTTERSLERRDYVAPEEVLREMREVLPWTTQIDWVTFTGSGEPTLHASLGSLIRAAKDLTAAPIAVLTNGTLLYRTDVQNDLLEADAVLPSLDAATPAVFRKLNRPIGGVTLHQQVEGLERFRKRYRGCIWLEILFVAGFNTSDEEVAALKRAVDRINPDKIHLNTVVRPPAYPAARPVSERKLAEIAAVLGERCEIASAPPAVSEGRRILSPGEIEAMLARRPMTAGEVAAALNAAPAAVGGALGCLLLGHRLKRVSHDGKIFYETPRDAVDAG